MSHPSPLAAAQHRALALRAAGDLSAARQLLAEAVGSPPPPYTDDHPEVLHTAHLLARLHREADDPLASRRVLEEAFAAGERRWEHSDPVVLALAFELAEVAEELGNRHEARRNYTRVATAGPAVLGEHHPAVRAARAYLGPPASAPTEQHDPPPTPSAEPIGAAADAGARSALSGPTLSLATLAAMRPSAGGQAATSSPWAPPATPRSTPPGVRAPAVPTPSSNAATAPPQASRVQPAPSSFAAQSSPPAAPTAPVAPGPARPALRPADQQPPGTAIPTAAPRRALDQQPPGPSLPAVDTQPGPRAESQPGRQRVESQPPRPRAESQPPRPRAESQPPRPRAESQPMPSSGQRPPHRSPSGPAVAPRQRVGDDPAVDASHRPSSAAAPTPTSPMPAFGLPAPRWDDPTIQVRQIEPLLAEEAARTGVRPTGMSGPVDASAAQPASPGSPSPTRNQPGPTQPVSGAPAHPVSAPPTPPQPVPAPPAYPHPVSAPPAHPVSASPGHTYPVSASPGHTYPVSAAPAFGQQISAPPMSGPPFLARPLSAPPVSAPSVSAPPAPPWGLTAPPWSRTSPPPTAGADDAGPLPTDAERTGADGGEFGLDILDAAVVPAQRARLAASDQTELLPAVVSSSGPARDFAGSAQPLLGAPQPHPVEPSQAAWSPGGGSSPPPIAQRPAPQYHPGQQPTQAEQDQYPTQEHRPIQDHRPFQAPYPGQQYHHPGPEAYRPPYADESDSAGRNRATLIGAVVAAGVAVVAVAGLGAVVLTSDDPPPGGSAPTAVAPTGAAPTAAGPPPGDLKLRDNSTTITLTWTDPSGGAVPFMVAAGRAGQALGVMATVDPGRTSYTVNGLNSRVDHCFTVLAVYSTDNFATSGQVCTARERSTPSNGKPSGQPSPS
ncbi:hypothetical protein ACQP2C_26000 [Micromonospora zamorensis]|uniref:hypothetical protein n=1 Tax=Micromonospora zamorensis TaxID=709883 RepID=UPI003D951E48